MSSLEPTATATAPTPVQSVNPLDAAIHKVADRYKYYYNPTFNEKLVDEVYRKIMDTLANELGSKSETYGKLQDFIIAICLNPPKYELERVNETNKGMFLYTEGGHKILLLVKEKSILEKSLHFLIK